MERVKIEGDGTRFWVRDGRGLQEVVPVVLVGSVDPDERNAGEHGDGLSPSDRSLEGFFGPRQNVNPGDIVTREVALATDGGGVIAAGALVPAPGAGSRLRLLGLDMHGANLVGGEAAIHGSVFRTEYCAQGHDTRSVNTLLDENLGATVDMAGGGAGVTYTFTTIYRIEDVV